MMEAKREVAMPEQGRRNDHAARGMAPLRQKTNTESLWSVSYRIGTQHDVSPEDLNRFLEQQFRNTR